MRGNDRRRLLLQFLEPSDALTETDPGDLVRHLSRALDIIPVTDLALGWRLGPTLVRSLRAVIPPQVTVWRWVPLCVDPETLPSGSGALAVGPGQDPPPPFRGLPEFRFLCLDHDEVVRSALQRAIRLAREVDASGVLLDRIRWPSPSLDPSRDLCCFCGRTAALATRDGIDLSAIAAHVASLSRSLQGRRSLVATLLGRGDDAVLTRFLAWRSERTTQAVRRVVGGLRGTGLRSALDVFTAALAPSVGQDLAGLAESGDWSKSMTYLDAIGPASMPYELRGYANWLDEAGEADPAGFLSGLLGFAAPSLNGHGEQLEALRVETSRLCSAVGKGRAVIGLDAVEIPGVCDVPDGDLVARLREVLVAGVGVAPSWELLFISPARARLIAEVMRS
jgi:hypothetical protein